jgi:hypothetical protein
MAEKISWLDNGPIGEAVNRTSTVPQERRSAAHPEAMLSHQSTGEEIVSFVNALDAASRDAYKRLQSDMCPPGFRWTSTNKLVAMQ